MQTHSTVVTVYSLSGPEIGVKHALKCRNCNYIYHYSAYGRKTSTGEKLYNQPRDLVEVSDVIYCERELYELLCSLRYISYICVYYNHTQLTLLGIFFRIQRIIHRILNEIV